MKTKHIFLKTAIYMIKLPIMGIMWMESIMKTKNLFMVFMVFIMIINL